MTATGDDADDLLPARMVNEYVYCPRLFYLEWVDGRFADNDDTVIGRHVHRVVDQETGAAPLPTDGDLLAARSVMLSSTEAGLVARLDLLEGDGGSVIPVDFKKGAPREDGTCWPPDETQLCIQAIVLRDNGYRCERGEIYYAHARRRVPVEFTEERLAAALAVAREARSVARQLKPPLPLVDSPKCVRCSLAGLCLPDETNLLLNRAPSEPRRLVPRDPDWQPVYVTEPGAFVGVRGGRLEITKDGEKLSSLRLLDVAQLCVYGRVQISTQAIHEMFDRSVPIMWFTYGGWLKGWASGRPSVYGELRRKQTIAHAQGGLGVARQMIEGKIRNCRTLLRRNARSPVDDVTDALNRLAVATRTCDDFGQLLGIEGTAARLYFSAFPKTVAVDALPLVAGFAADGRNRRPPRDPLNCMLSFCYSLLTKDLVAVTLGVGFDPYLGLFHRSRYGRPALALDLAEEFRPLIADSVVLSLLNNAEMSAHDFVTRAGGVALTADGRRKMLRAYERRLATTVTHPVFKYKVSYRRVMDVQARLLAAVLIDELPEYTAMTTR